MNGLEEDESEFTKPYERKEHALCGVLAWVKNPDNLRPWNMEERLHQAISELREMVPTVPKPAMPRILNLIAHSESLIVWAQQKQQAYWDSARLEQSRQGKNT